MTVFLADYVTHTLFELCGGLPVADFTDSYFDSDSDLETAIGDNPKAAAVALKAASGATQQWYCQEATRHIDQLALAGQKYDTDIIAGVAVQPLQFPRIIDGVTCDWNDSTDLPIVPQAVKDACMEEALAIFSQGAGGRRDLQEQGVASYSIGGKLQETFRPGAGTENLLSSKARRIMRRFVGAEIR